MMEDEKDTGVLKGAFAGEVREKICSSSPQSRKSPAFCLPLVCVLHSLCKTGSSLLTLLHGYVPME